MQLRRRSYVDPKTGQKRKQERWTLRFSDHRGLKRSIALLERRSASESMAQKIERLVDARRGGEPISAAMNTWLARMPRRILEKLIEWNVVDSARIASTTPIATHIERWRQHLENKGNTKAYIKGTVARVERAFEGTRVRFFGDIDALTLEDWFGTQTGPNGWSTSNQRAYVQSCKQFTNWMRMQRLAAEDPLFTLRGRTQGAERQRTPTRALSLEECRRLILAAERSRRTIHGVDGRTRALAYRIALQTGLRLRELSQLRVQAVKWAEGPGQVTTLVPFVDETKAGQKTGRQDVLVVVAELERHLREACRGRHAKAYLLPGMWRPKALSGDGAPVAGADLMRIDLGTAGIPYIDEAGERAGFHSLRHTFQTLAAQSGISLNMMMKVARHTDPKVTARYLHAELRGIQDALEKVPGLDPEIDPPDHSEVQARRAAGSEMEVPPMVPPLVPDRSNQGEEKGSDTPPVTVGSRLGSLSKSVGWGFESLLPCHSSEASGPPGSDGDTPASARAEGASAEQASAEDQPGGIGSPPSGPTSPSTAEQSGGDKGANEGTADLAFALGDPGNRGDVEGSESVAPEVQVVEHEPGTHVYMLDPGDVREPTLEDRRRLAAQALELAGDERLPWIIRLWGAVPPEAQMQVTEAVWYAAGQPAWTEDQVFAGPEMDPDEEEGPDEG